MLVHVNTYTPSLIIHWLSGCSRIIFRDESGDLYVGPHLNIENFLCPLFATNCPWVQLQVTMSVSINSKSVVEPDRRKQNDKWWCQRYWQEPLYYHCRCGVRLLYYFWFKKTVVELFLFLWAYRVAGISATIQLKCRLGHENFTMSFCFCFGSERW